MLQDFCREIVARAQILYCEIVNGRNVTGLHEGCLAVDERPGGVGVVVQREGLLLTILAQDKRCFVLGTGCSRGNFHRLGYVHANAIGAKVKLRQIIQAPKAVDEREHQRVVDDNPLGVFAHKACHVERFPAHDGTASQQYNVFEQSLCVGEMDGIAKATAIFHGVAECQSQCHQRHEHHEDKGQPRDLASADGKQKQNSQGEFQGRERHRCAQ